MAEMKLCNRCLEVKPRTEFTKDRKKKDGLCPWCKQCKSDSSKDYESKNKQKRLELNYLNHYGITLHQYRKLAEAQNGRCAICGRAPRTKLVVDHDHATNLIRGLLCQGCNTALGQFGDDINLLIKACRYLISALLQPNKPAATLITADVLEEWKQVRNRRMEELNDLQ